AVGPGGGGGRSARRPGRTGPRLGRGERYAAHRRAAAVLHLRRPRRPVLPRDGGDPVAVGRPAGRVAGAAGAAADPGRVGARWRPCRRHRGHVRRDRAMSFTLARATGPATATATATVH